MEANLNHDQAQQVQQMAYDILVADLEAVGNVLSDLHKEALEAMVAEMTGFATNRLSGRRCFSLGTGCGKPTVQRLGCGQGAREG